MGLTQKPIVNILVGDFNASDRYHQKTACMSTPTKKQIKTQYKIVSSSSLVWDTKHFWASQQHSAAQEERELNQSMSCGFTLHICVSRLLEYHFGFSQYNP